MLFPQTLYPLDVAHAVSRSTFDFSWDSASVPCLPTLSFYLLTLVVTGGLLSRVRY